MSTNDAEYNRQYQKRRRQQAKLIIDLRKASPCTDCGGRFPADVMEFDHVDAGTKTADVSRLVGRARPSVILAEMVKCDLVCANCHRLRTLVRRLDKQESLAPQG